MPKNENVNEDMLDILIELQQKYGLKVAKEISDFILFGGDQLTEERSRNMQFARFDGRSMEERLEGLWPKFEDWHGIRIAYEVKIIKLIMIVYLNLWVDLITLKRPKSMKFNPHSN